MTFELPFHEKIYSDQMNLAFNLAWKTNLKKNKRRLYWGIPSLLFGVFQIFLENYLGFLFLGLGLHYLINYFEFYNFYRIRKRTYFNMVTSEIGKQKEVAINTVWEFNDEYFAVRDYIHDIKIKWSGFESFSIIENTLLLYLNYHTSPSYTISKTELEETDFEKIIAFLETKIGHSRTKQ